MGCTSIIPDFLSSFAFLPNLAFLQTRSRQISRPFLGLVIFWLGSPNGIWAQREGPSGPQLISITPVAAKPGSEVELSFQVAEQGKVRSLIFGQEGIETLEIANPEELSSQPAPTGNPRDRRLPMAQAGSNRKVTAKVKISPDISTGLIDIRLATDLGVSNPRSLLIRSGEEFIEKEPNNETTEAQELESGKGVTGTIQTPTDVDYFKIPGKKGQKITLVLRTSTIDSRLNPQLELFDSKGRPAGKLARLIENDQVIAVVPRSDGPLFARISSQAYLQGGNDSFYHLSNAREPVIQAVFPPVIALGQKEQLRIYGWNLPEGKETGDGTNHLEKAEWPVSLPEVFDESLLPRTTRFPRMAFTDGFEERLTGPGGSSQPFLVGFSRDKVAQSTGENHEWSKAQKVELPTEITGFFAKKGNKDWYRFKATKGQILGLETLGDKLGSNIDIQVTLFRFPTGSAKPTNPLLELDDNPEILHPQMFFSRSEDPAPTTITLPESGEYLVRVAHRETDLIQGPSLQYRLRIGEPRPDFLAVAIPANQAHPEGLNIRPGGTTGLMIFCHRRHGFSGPIRVEASALPQGCSAEPITLGAGQRSGLLLIQANNQAGDNLSRIRLRATGEKPSGEGAAVTVQHEVRMASLLWPHPSPNNNQTVPLLVRLNQGEWISVREKPTLGATVGNPPQGGHVIAPGGQIELTLKIQRSDRFNEVCDVLIAGTPNANSFTIRGTLANRPLTIPPDQSEVKVIIEARNQIPPGVYPLALRVHTQEKEDKTKRSVIDFTEAIPVTYLPPRLVDITPAPGGTRWKPGMAGTIPVTINRVGGFDGPVKVELFCPDGKDLCQAQSVEATPDQNRVLVPVEMSFYLPANKPVRLIARATVQIGSTEKTTESRFNLQLTK